MQAFAVALGGAAIMGGAAGYTLTWWRNRKTRNSLPRRDLLVNVAFGAVLGFLALAMAPKMAASIHPPVWHKAVTPVTTCDELNEILNRNGDRAVVVYFYAPWCVPCRAMAPNINELARHGRKIVTVDVDEARHLAHLYNVKSVPTVYAFNGGDVAYSGLGYHSLKKLREITR